MSSNKICTNTEKNDYATSQAVLSHLQNLSVAISGGVFFVVSNDKNMSPNKDLIFISLGCLGLCVFLCLLFSVNLASDELGQKKIYSRKFPGYTFIVAWSAFMLGAVAAAAYAAISVGLINR